jgi:glutamate/aspartate transport system substrate-binding protein
MNLFFYDLMSRKAPLWVAIGLSLCASSVLAQSPSTIERIKQTRTINLGHRDSAVPFSYLDQDKRPVGYSVELCSRIVESLKKEWKLPDLKINWVLVQSAERLPFVKDGKVDIECGNTTATAERAKQVDFTVPTFIAGSGVMVRSELKVTTLKDLRGKKIAVTAGSTGEKIIARANEASMGLVVTPVKSNSEAFAALQSRQADAWVTDDILLAAYRAQHSNPKEFELLVKRHTIEPLALMYRKGEPDFAQRVDRELITMINSGEVQKIYQRWFVSPIPPKGINLEVPASRFLRETWRIPTKIQADVDIILF